MPRDTPTVRVVADNDAFYGHPLASAACCNGRVLAGDAVVYDGEPYTLKVGYVEAVYRQNGRNRSIAIIAAVTDADGGWQRTGVRLAIPALEIERIDAPHAAGQIGAADEQH